MNFEPNLVFTNNYLNPETLDEETLDKTPLFVNFLKTFKRYKASIYSDVLIANASQGINYLEVNYSDLSEFDSNLASQFKSRPKLLRDQFVIACKRVISDNLKTSPQFFQVMINSYSVRHFIRDLKASLIERMVRVSGIITSASKIGNRLVNAHLICVNCQESRIEYLAPGLASLQIPRRCTAQQNMSCPLDPFMLVADKSSYEDYQILKLQEFPEDVPSGEVPRSIRIFVRGALVGKISTGTRISATGVLSVFNLESSNNGGYYLQAYGMEGHSKPTPAFSDSRPAPLKYEDIWKSIGASIFGHDDVKMAIACQLFGGTTRSLPGGMRLRGDMNVLLLGDPSVAKSQFLKEAQRIAPISVFTSGKGSSAAGLTAAVLRDPVTGEFSLEGGAMVLADGGLVCIDEFDKMREQDRVAIHEAMEQQTISIAKAGITSVLNSRTSVLAAANPSLGRYDTERSGEENIDFQSTILSRFDLIFILLDKANREEDANLSAHVIEVHQGKAMKGNKRIIDISVLQEYISYARNNIFPVLEEEAREYLVNEYVVLRNNAERSNALPLTIRQLEAMARTTEAIARMKLQDIATKEHAQEAVRLFKASTIKAASLSRKIQSKNSIFQGNRKERLKLRKNIEDCIRRLCHVGGSAKKGHVVSEVMRLCKCDFSSVENIIGALVAKGDFDYSSSNKLVRKK